MVQDGKIGGKTGGKTGVEGNAMSRMSMACMNDVFGLTMHHCYELSCDDIRNLLLCHKSGKEVVLGELSHYVKQRPGGNWIMDVRAQDQVLSLVRLSRSRYFP
jgi:hypothetical protein